MKNVYKLIVLIVLLTMSQITHAQIIGDTSVCKGENTQYTLPNPGGATYLWSLTGGSNLGPINSDTLTVSWPNAGTGTLLVTLTLPNNTQLFYTLNVIIHPKPSPQITHTPYPGCPPEGQEHGAGTPDQGGKDLCEKVCQFATLTYQTAYHPGSTYLWVATGAQLISGDSTNTVTVTWDSTAMGSLTVYETNQWGCLDSSVVCIEKMDLPVALFNHQLSVCKGSTVYFNNQSTGANSFQWYFGDNSGSTQTNPTHIYNNAGTYTITLIAISDCYCTDTFQSVITVDSLPGPDISCPSTVCAFDTAVYSTSQAGCIYNWFVNGGTISGPSNQQSVTVIWGAGQTGMLGLYVSGCSALCSDTTWIYIPIIPAVATIAGPVKVCPGDCETYSIPNFSGATYSWTLNNGSCGTISDTSCCGKVEICWPPFSAPCVDTLTVTYYDAFLGCGGTAVMPIRVRPRLSIYGMNHGCSNASSNFFASSGVVCNWNVSPGGPVYSPGPSPSLNVSWIGQTGTFMITAIPLNPNQVCNDSASTFVTVVAPPPAPSITGDTVVCPNSVNQYCAVSNGNINWIITGGSPSNGSGNCITVTWGNTPPFTVQAYEQMTGSPYCSSDTSLLNINIPISLPAPTINGNPSACANSTNNYSSPTAYPAGASFTWALSPANSGTITSGQGSNSILIEWGNNAPQTVTLSLSVDICGQTVTNNLQITLNPPPVPLIVQAGNLCPGSTAQLNATGGVFAAYQWSGPGGFTSTSNPAIITQNGLYQLTVTDAGGCTALTQITVHYVGIPQAIISSQNPLGYCIGASYSVNLCALGNPNYTYAWSNGPTTQCNLVNTPGSYQVTVTDASNGCFNLSNILTVHEDSCVPDTGSCVPAGTVSFTHSSCNPKVFTNTSSGATSFSWDFGDLTYSNAASPTHTYNQAGFYIVTLYGYVPNSAGTDSCLLTDTALIEIPLLPRFTFTTGCFGDSACFTDNSVFTAGNNITSWSWNFGDAGTSSLQNPCHLYTLPGTYIVTLTIANSSCTTSWQDTLVIPPKPLAAFSFGSVNCVNSPIGFSDLSTTNINYWNWDFGNGGTSLNQNPSQSYSPAGTYQVTLIVHDIQGCYDTLAQTVTVNATYAGGSIIASPDTIVCSGTTVLLVAPICAGCSYNWSNGSINDSISVNSTAYYFLTVTDSNGCNYQTHIQIIVNQPPSALITSAKNDLCLGEYAVLSVPNNINWLYYWLSNDTTVNGQQFASVFVSPANPGTYSYQVILTDTITGCSDTTQPFYLAVHQPPVPPLITALGPSTVCKGDTIILLGTHPDPTVTLQWSTGEVNDTISVTDNGCYTLVVTDTNGCTAQATYCVTVNPLPALCSFYEGCFDTCAPYTIKGPAGGTSYQWLLNGIPIPGDTLQNCIASVSGIYSLVVTNSFGCTDTTGAFNLTLFPCPENLCADLSIDSIYCDPASGTYVMLYHVVNQTALPVSQVNLQILPPNLSTAYAPYTVNVNIPAGDTSGQLTATIYNGIAGSTLCFRAHISSYDSIGEEILCCASDTVCVTLPACGEDTTCCYFNIIHDSIWCVTTASGEQEYYFEFEVSGCGELIVSAPVNGTISLDYPLVMEGGYYSIFGIFTAAEDSVLCLTFVINDSLDCCSDTTFCFALPLCPPPLAPCPWKYPPVICAGSTALFQYGIIIPSASYNWQFPGGIPSSAVGIGPHSVSYLNPGTYPVQLVVTNAHGTSVCVDSIVVLPNPSATILQSGTTLYAQPAGLAYQWYAAPVGPATLISGANSQYFSPASSGTYCVVVSNTLGCADTACIDYSVPPSGCCSFSFIEDSVWCTSTPTGSSQYHFSIKVKGCGTIFVSGPNDGSLTLNYPLMLPGGISTISGTYTNTSSQYLCLTFTVHDSISYCADTTICFQLPECGPVMSPCDYLLAGFTEVSNGLTSNFNDQSTAGGGLSIIGWYWNFGDPLSGLGNTSSLPNPLHTFSGPGTYQVCMVVIGIIPGTSVICAKMICKDITVEEITVNPCDSLQADFTYGQNGLLLTFVDLSTTAAGFTINGWSWNFGDPFAGANNFSSLQNPSHVFSSGGYYNICLIITASSPDGTMCTDSVCRKIFIEAPPLDPCDSLYAQFTYTALWLNAQFTNTTLFPNGMFGTSWSWNFGDPASGTNNVSNLQNPNHVFSAAGYYNVCLAVSAVIEGMQIKCYDTLCMTIHVSGPFYPDADAGLDTVILHGGSVILHGFATDGTPPYTYSWSPSLGLSDPNIPEPLASPAETTTYWLTVTDANGLSDTDDVIVTVIPLELGTIAGTVSYANVNSTLLNNVTVTLWSSDSLTDTKTTNSAGYFSFSGLLPGNYSIHCSSGSAWGGVNSTDALMITRHFVGIVQLTGIRETAADVDAGGYINATDALFVMKRFVGILSSFPAGDWAFEQGQALISGNETIILSIKGLCFGDVDASNIPQNSKSEPRVFLKKQGTQFIDNQQDITIPIGLAQASGLEAVSLVLHYPYNEMEILGVATPLEGENLWYNTVGDELRIGWYSLQPRWLEENAPILFLTLRLKKERSGQLPDLDFRVDPESSISVRGEKGYEQQTLTIPELSKSQYDFTLYQNMPNPCSSVTSIPYFLPAEGHIKLELTDALGKTLSVLIESTADAGNHLFELDASLLEKGIYFYRMIYSSERQRLIQTKRMVVTP